MINPSLKDKVEKKSLKMIKKNKMSQLGLTYQTHISDPEIRVADQKKTIMKLNLLNNPSA